MIKQLQKSTVLAALAAVILSSTVLAQEVTVEHAQGTTEVPVSPGKVFSYDYATIDTLTALGIEVQGAPPLAGRVPSWLPEGMLDIGSLFEPDYEIVNAEQPDLIVVAGRSADAYSELAGMAPTIDLTFQGGLHDSLSQNALILGEIFGRQEDVKAELAEIDARIADLAPQVQEGGDGLLLMVTGGGITLLNPDTARASRGALLFETLGLEPTIADIQEATHGEPISFEFLLRVDPGRLFVIDRDAAIGTEDAQPAAAVLDNELMHQTSAWQNDRIAYLDPFNWYIITGAGLTTMNEMLDEIEAIYSR